MPFGSLGMPSFVVHTPRFTSAGQSPGTFAMTPTRCVADAPRAGLKTKLAVSLGPFYGPRQAKQWSKGLKDRDEALGRTPEAHMRRTTELKGLDVAERVRLHTTHGKRLKEEREKHKNGYGNLGSTEDTFSVHVSALTGDVTANTPRFLETFPTAPNKPAAQELELRKSHNPMLLGSLPLDQVTKENRSINYDPINHKYQGAPRIGTALQRRAMKERTGYVTVAGGRKDLAKEARGFDAMNSTMQHYVKYEYQKVDPVENWLHDEQTSASGGLRTFPAQKGVSPLTRRLVQCHDTNNVKTWHVNQKQRQRKIEDLTEERIAVNKEQRVNHEKKMALQLSTFKIKDPYSDHMWGINFDRQAKPFRGYNTSLQRHYQPEDENVTLNNEHVQAAEKMKIGAKRKPNETYYNILHGADKRPGKEGMMPGDEPAPPLTARQVSERKNSQHLKGLIGHDHSLDPKVNGFHTTHKQSYDSPRKQRARFGVKSGTKNEDYLRYEAGQDQVHMASHANDESRQRDKKWEHHGHEDAADRYGTGRVHIKQAGHTNVESGSAEHSQLNAHGANINRAQIRYEANNNLVLSHRTDETGTAEDWNAGSDPKYQQMEKRTTGATIVRRRKSITKKAGSDKHVSLKAQRHAQHLDEVAGPVAHRRGSRVADPRAMAHHGKGFDHNVSEETDAAHATGQSHRSMANNGEDFMRFDHAQHHHTSYAHNEDETSEANQFSSANIDGEQNRFYETNGGFGDAHHKAVGIDETTASKQIWEAMAVKGYETVEKRKGPSVLVEMYKKDDPSASVKDITSKDRIPLRRQPRADHWKFDGDQNTTYVPRPPPRRTDATSGVARFI